MSRSWCILGGHRSILVGGVLDCKVHQSVCDGHRYNLSHGVVKGNWSVCLGDGVVGLSQFLKDNC